MLMKFSRHLSLVLLMIFAAVTVTASVACASTTISRPGVIHYIKSGSTSKVSKFEVKGKPAYCMENPKTPPETGTRARESEYNKNDFNKYLYYGYGGPAQWEGFKSSKDARLVTSILVSFEHYKVKRGSFDKVAGYNEFLEFLKDKEIPTGSTTPSSTSLEGEFKPGEDYQCTDEVSLTGDEGAKLKLELPDNMILHSNTSDKDFTGTVELDAGDKFYLKTSDEGFFNTEVKIRFTSTRARVTRYVTKKSYTQDLVQMSLEWDKPGELEVRWQEKEKPKYADLIIRKVGSRYVINNGRLEKTSSPLSGARFSVEGPDGFKKEIVTDSDGIARLTELIPAEYSVKEIAAPEGYILDKEAHTVNLSIDEDKEHLEYTLRLENEKKTGNLTIVKADSDNEMKLPDAVFEIKDAEGNSLEVRTDERGLVNLRNLPTGTYTITETEAPEGYRNDAEPQTINLGEDDNKPVTCFFYDSRIRPASGEATTPPDTGDRNLPIKYIIALLSCLGGLLVLTVARRCDKL